MEFDRALYEWRERLGTNYVLTEKTVRDKYARSTQSKGTYPLAVLLPADSEQVSAVVRIAATYSVPIYPISRGCNWGYGDACAIADNQVIVDLSRMNRIHEINESLAYAVIEPGVTQGELYEQLKQTSLWMDVTGAGSETSIIGNVMERGFGHSPYGDRFQMSAGYEVVLPDGRILTTGFGHYPHAKTTYLYKSGVGPALDGLFTQSNLGIVVKMAIWLMPKPECMQGFVFSVPNDKDIAPLVEALRPLRLSGIVQNTVHIGNDLRVISSNSRYPWNLTQGKTPLPETLRETMRRQLKIGMWTGTGALYGTRRTVGAARAEVKRSLQGIAKVQFFDSSLLTLGEKVTEKFQKLELCTRLSDRIQIAQSVLDLLNGVPTSQYLAGVGWRSQTPPIANNLNPLDNDWGLFWIAPVLPMTGEAVLNLLSVIEPGFQKYEFEPQITLSSINPRSLCCIITITYNKKDLAESDRAQVCYDSMLEQVMGNGYIPYRSGIQSMKELTKGSNVFWDVATQIKASLDPKGILSPGRYIPIH